MSIAVVLGLLLLLGVGALALWQRRGVRDMTSPTAPRRRDTSTMSSPANDTPARAASPSQSAFVAVRSDPVVGKLGFDGDRAWHSTEALDFGMGFVDVEFIAGPEGPTAEHTDWMRRAAAGWGTLQNEIERLLAEQFASSGVARESLLLYWVRVGPRSGTFEGRIEYILAPAVDGVSFLYVQSTDKWATLAPHIEAIESPASSSPVADTIHDPELGLLVYDEVDGWTREDDLDFAGAAVSLTVAGTSRPGEAHRELLRAALADAAALDARARAIVIPELRRRRAVYDDLVPYQMAFGRVEGATCGYLWYCVGDFSGEIGVSSRDRWRTLALEVVEP
jgi:hypothetical protein